MAVIGNAELLVTLKLAPNAAAQLKREMGKFGGAGTTSAQTINVKAQVDPAAKKKMSRDIADLAKESEAAERRLANMQMGSAKMREQEIRRLADLQRKAAEDNAKFTAARSPEALRAKAEEDAIRARQRDRSRLAASRRGDILLPEDEVKALQARLQRAGGFFQSFQNRANASLGKVGLSVRSLSLALGAGFLAGDILAIALRSLIGALKNAISSSSALIEQQTATKRVFEESAVAVENFAQKTAQAFGFSERAALQTNNQFGLLFEGAGATADQAAQLAIGFTQLAGDIASFNDLQEGAEEGARRLRGGLVGETEQLRVLGVNITAITTKQAALNYNITRQGEELDSTAAALVRYVEILDNTKKQQGDSITTGDNLAGTLRKTKAASEDASAALGKSLQPTVIRLTKAWTNLKNEIADTFDAYERWRNRGIARQREEIVGLTDAQLTRQKALSLNPLEIAAINDEQKARKGLNNESVETLRLKQAEENATKKQIAIDAAKAKQELKRQSPEELSKRVDAAMSILGLQNAEKQSLLGIKQAELGVLQAEEARNEVLKRQSRHVHDLAEAHNALAQAQLGVRQADLAQRQTALDTADILSGVDRQERQFDVTMRLAEAHLSLEEAQDAQLRAQLALNRASLTGFDIAERMVRATRGARFNARELLSAQLDQQGLVLDQRANNRDLVRAPLAVKRAELDLKKAIREESRFSAEQDIREASAKLQIEGASLAVQSALLAERAAHFRVTDVMDDERKMGLELQAADLALAGAKLNVVSAVDAHARATVELKKAIGEASGVAFTFDQQLELYIKTLGPAYSQTITNNIGDLDRLIAKYHETQAAKMKAEAHAQFTGGGGGDFGGHGASGSWADTKKIDWKKIGSAIADGIKGAFGFQHGGPLPGLQHGGEFNIPGAQHGRRVRQESLIRIGEAGPEILAIRPGHRPEVLQNGAEIPGSGVTIGTMQIVEATNPHVTARRMVRELGRRSMS